MTPAWIHCLRITLACAVVVLGPLCPPAEAQAPITMKVATVNAGDSPRNTAAYEFARAVGERSKGRIKAEVYINNQLARGEGATLEGIQLGTIDVAPVGSAPIGGIFEPAYLPLDLPFLWTSREQAWKVMDGPIGQELFKKIHYSIVVVAATGIGLFLPPIGVGLFISCGIANISVDRAVGPMLPYVGFLCLGLLLVILFPWLTLVLPRLFNL